MLVQVHLILSGSGINALQEGNCWDELCMINTVNIVGSEGPGVLDPSVKLDLWVADTTTKGFVNVSKS